MQAGIAPISRRGFLGTVGGAAALGGMAMVSAKTKAASKITDLKTSTPIKVKPVLVYSIPQRKEKTSWRMYGGLHNQNDVDLEAKRIAAELKDMASKADFAIQVLPLVKVNSNNQAAQIKDSECDVILIYASGGRTQWLETIAASKKPKIMFVRHKSGPIYSWYEIAHFWFLRKIGETIREPNMDIWDIVVDDYQEVLWRLRSLYGLHNAMGTKVLAIGGLQSYSQLGTKLGPPHAKNIWNFEIIQVTPQEFDQRMKKARADQRIVKEAQRRTERLLAQKNVSLHTDKKFVVNTFLTLIVVKGMMAETGATNVGVARCMTSLISITQTPPCLVLSLLNDEGYTAFCHVDFTHTPAGILLHHISQKPSFVCNTHYPYNSTMTLAHCSAPRKMNGKDYETTEITTHFESDYGAATKVYFSKGQLITALIPNLSCTKWMGFKGKITDSPSYDVCRSQIDMKIDGDWKTLLKDIQGFHAIVCYGDYLREVEYAIKKLGIQWQNISENA
jgi:hypothetical protein